MPPLSSSPASAKLYSAINQQIALKTIKKFGFSVNAVWNGKEALDYLLATPSSSHPKPNIILMDCQMPILDGYRATHLIRHHAPYSTREDIRMVPIVAMTASAIQGDMEKCKNAGMDDYLAKPVRGKTLENMLLKWAIEGQRKARLQETFPTRYTDHESSCTEPGTPDVGPISKRNPAFSEHSKKAHTLPGASTFSNTLTEGESEMRRVEAEEKAALLRDDKLLAASEAHLSGSSPVGGPTSDLSARPGLPNAALTEENVGILDRESSSRLAATAANGQPALGA